MCTLDIPGNLPGLDQLNEAWYPGTLNCNVYPAKSKTLGTYSERWLEMPVAPPASRRTYAVWNLKSRRIYVYTLLRTYKIFTPFELHSLVFGNKKKWNKNSFQRSNRVEPFRTVRARLLGTSYAL